MNWPGVRTDDAFRLLDRDYKYRGKVVTVSVDHFRLPGGYEGRHDVLHLPSAVAVVPLLETPDGGCEVVLVEQFRNSMEGFIHEIPAGILEEGEDPSACAARELEEETGYRAGRLRHLVTLFPIPGTSAHKMYFYLAEGLHPGTQQLEAAECLTVKRFRLDALLDSILARASAPPVVTIVDGKTHIGILHTVLLKQMERKDPRSSRESAP
jgi:ADP-ribose pyrophosphatase